MDQVSQLSSSAVEATVEARDDKKLDDWTDEKRIVDEKTKKPDDWDNEEDGEWEVPMKVFSPEE